jgi:subtilase family serine protease
MRFKTSILTACSAVVACSSAPSASITTRSNLAVSARVSVSSNTPGFIKNATDLGPVDPEAVISVTVWLKLHNEEQLDQLVQQQYTRGHANFQKWITQDQFNAQFSPTAQEANAVQNWLSAHGLTTLAVAENNFYVKVQGAVADVEKAFHVQIDSFSVNGQTFRSNTSDPSINDSSGNHVAAVTGMDDYGFSPKNVRPVEADGTPAPFVAIDPSAVTPDGAFFERACFRAPQTHTFAGPGVSATYTGNRYGADITNTAFGHLAPCGYSPRDVRAAYHINDIYAAGLQGDGETIVITDAFGSATIEEDAAFFSSFYGLPPIDLTIVKAPGIVHNPDGTQLGWNVETTLDVEWAHAIAPNAKIALVLATDQSSLDEAINLAVVHHLGNTISNSWASLEGFGNPVRLGRVNRILEMAAAQGIDVNFSSGDNGDDQAVVGFKTVEFPGSSPFATSIGGTSLAMDSKRNVLFETGWGTNLTRIANRISQGSTPVDPPLNDPRFGLGFQFGAGGGTSLTFAKPAFQSGLTGTMRQVPDIAMLADPFTGVEIIETIQTPTGPAFGVGVIGGTSLASPLFSGVMALAAQKAGHGLGQAAARVYALPAGAVKDVVPPASSTNVSGSITDGSGTKFYNAGALAAPLETTAAYYSAFYNSPFSTRWFVITFNTDTSLSTAVGWDNVTGVGTPNGLSFVNGVQ